MKKKAIILTVAGFTILFSCKKNTDPKPNNPGGGEQELITRFELHFKNVADTMDQFTFKFTDPEGEGKGSGPVTETINLNKGTAYDVEVKIFDDTKSPVVAVHEEIEEESNYHRFHYTFTAAQATPNTGMAINITDIDKLTPPQPLGLNFSLVTGTVTGTGTLNVNLRHFDEGAAKSSDPNAGEQDVNIDFPVIIQ